MRKPPLWINYTKRRILSCRVDKSLGNEIMYPTIIIQHARNSIQFSKYRKIVILINVITVQANKMTVVNCHKNFFLWAWSYVKPHHLSSGRLSVTHTFYTPDQMGGGGGALCIACDKTFHMVL